MGDGGWGRENKKSVLFGTTERQSDEMADQTSA